MKKEATIEETEFAQIMLNHIYDKINVSKDKIPNFDWKYGGYRATYRHWDHTVEIRIDSWRKMNLVTKRLIMCHEVIHALGGKHSNIFGAILDLLPMELYGEIWGWDDEYWDLDDNIEQTIKELIARNQK